ncbi:hypothetical protein MMYC01_202708 [Madurella mycetomatis]|uniref:Uncharacterized protein n=1 Tax=Madurella mycetomatis TaxID=100816 RepID=A0A175WAG1_9PEZI|nr:hypothetical protein MMYC01_202708 [Madurella mycetomatis]
MATAIEVQIATATVPDANGATILSGAPKSEALSSWWREIRQLRRLLPAPRPRPSESTVDPRDTDLGVPSLVSASATVSATTSEELRRVAPPVQNPAQALQASATGTGVIDVEVRLTIQERLQTLVLASALGLKADRMADFTKQEEEALRQFQAAYDENRTIWFRGKRMPSVIFDLVALGSDGTDPASRGRSETSICVRGLHSEDDIKKFHTVMSRSAIRRLYSGLRLSYDKTLIQRPAREVNEEYKHLARSPGETLCGTRLVTWRPGHSEWSSTIGGIIQVDGELYAMTSSHMPDNDEVAPEAASLVDMSSPSTLVDDDYDDDVEPALILDPPRPSKSVSGGENDAEMEVPVDTPSYFWPALTVRGPTLEHGDDWRLIRLSTKHCLPNSVLQVREHASAARRTYLTEYLDEKPSRSKVSIFAGFSGLCRGTLLSSPAFLSIRGAAPTEVWTTVLDNGITLQKGDSGSWAIDDRGRWIGTVTALSGQDAYLIPAYAQLQQIQCHFKLPVTLPSPLRCYLTLAADKSCPDADADSFATKALTPDVLIASASDMGRMALTLAMVSPEKSLKALLRSMGTELSVALKQPVGSDLGKVLEPSSLLALIHLGKIYDSIVANGRTGSRAEIQKVFESRKPADDGYFISPEPHGTSPDAGTKPGLPPEPIKEKPSEMPNLTTIHQHDNEASEKHGISHRRAFVYLIVESIVLSSVSALAGMAALAALVKVQPSLRPSLQRGLFAATSPPVAALGSITGLCLAAPLVLENALYRFMRSLARHSSWLLVFSFLLYILALIAMIFARATVAVVVVSTVLSIDISNNTGLFAAALAASAPLLIDTILNSMPYVACFNDWRREEGDRDTSWHLSPFLDIISFYPACVGWDALAGYTFARVAGNYDVGFVDGGAAAAAGAVFGTVIYLWPPLALAAVILLRPCFPIAKEQESMESRWERRWLTLLWDLRKKNTSGKAKGKEPEASAPLPVPVLAPPPMFQHNLAVPSRSPLPPREPIGNTGVYELPV